MWQFRSDADYDHWNEHGFPYRPGDDPNATQVLFQPSLREREPLVASIMRQMPGYVAGTFWSDGMERVSGREFNAMFESGCYQRGEMSCLSCHAMHQPPGEARADLIVIDEVFRRVRALYADSTDPKDANAWFVAFAPADRPRVAVAVMLVGAGFGGTAAAPVAREVLAAAL